MMSAQGNRIGGQEASMARRRYQNPKPDLRGNRWEIRIRRDLALDDGSVVRKQQRVVLGTKNELPTEKLAIRAAKPILDKLNSSLYRPETVTTFADFAERWQATVLPEMKPSTQYDYRSIIRVHLLPAFGKYHLHAITPEMIQSFIVRKKQEISAGRTWNILTVMRSIWNTGLAWGKVSENPFKHIVFRTPDRKPGRYFTPQEVRQILGASEEPYKTFYRLAAETGLRAGELLSLRCCDVDTEARGIFVRRALSKGVAGRPKSRSGLRDFPISRDLSLILQFLIGRQAASMTPLFGQTNGRPWTYWHILKWHLQPLLKRLGIACAGLHAFRHASASVGARHAPPKVMQERLGHADPRMTLALYEHAMGEDHREAAEAIGREFAPDRVM
jgi:integrase